MDSTFIIAEAGANHDRDIEQAFKLIDIAVNAKADAVKFQTYSSDTMYSKNTPDFAQYKNIPELIKSLELPREWQQELFDYCCHKQIEFISTPFDENAVDQLMDVGVKRFKIAGFEATDPRFVKYVASTNLPIVISAGIGCDIDMVDTIYEWIREENTSGEITFLHCNNAYPTPFEDINLGQMSRLIKKWEPAKTIHVGLSDHTLGTLIPPIAVGMGAKCIEKHFTISRHLCGPDHSFAVQPEELKEMIQTIRLVETCLGNKEEYSKSEENFKMARRSVVAKSDISQGQSLTLENITTKRPMTKDSIPASMFYSVLGKKAGRDIYSDDILSFEDING